jgi:peptide-methionine (R)-S-oxide reductase
MSFIKCLNGNITFMVDTQKKISEEEWKKKLSKEQFHVLRKKGTERPFTGELLDNHEEGNYCCSGCGVSLFESHSKFESGSGWPSFYQVSKEDNIQEEIDSTLGIERKEILCKHCGGHLGHVFNDGPNPTGLRYCVNSLSLNFKKKE